MKSAVPESFARPLRLACWCALAWLLWPGLAPAAQPGAMQGLQRIEAGLRAAEAIRAVKRLQYSYAHYLDAGMWSEAADLFARDGRIESGTGHAQGRDAIRRHLMRAAGRNAAGLATGQLHAHLVMQPIVNLDADGRMARGTWHELALLGQYGQSASWKGGIYENDYVFEDGRWKIARMRYFPQYAGEFDDFGHRAPPQWNVPYHFEARHVGLTVPATALDALMHAQGGQVEGGLLAARLQRLADETAVQNLQHAFGYYLDRKMWDDIADLFTATGEMELLPQGVYVGPQRIRAALANLHGAPPLNRGELFDHILVGTVVTVSPDGNSAAARSTQLSMLGRGGEYARWELGVYENHFVKEGGKWKLDSLRYFPRLSTDYDLGWARDARPAPVRSATLPPDRPSAAFSMYPHAQGVSMHFTHPVTARSTRVPSAKVAAVATITEGPPEASRTIPALATLERSLHDALAVDAVENLNSSYGYYLDESDWDGMADTYASNGAKEITGAGVYVGPERIRRILKLRGPTGGRTPDFYTIHQLVQPVIHVSADGLKANARLRLFQGGGSADGSSGSWIGGIYENTAQFENGEWKFGIQDLHHIFNASYRNGWARVGPFAGTLKGRAPSPRDERGGGITQGLGGARGGPRLADEMPPDRPIRARQYAFPDIVEPAFHYVNPVSGRAPPDMTQH